MSRSLQPKSSSPNYAHNADGYVPFTNLAMQRLSKLLIDGAISTRNFRMEVLRYLIYPKTLTHYPIHRHGWLAVLDKYTLTKMRESGQLKALNDAISRIEADTSLSAYARVGKITEAIKESTGKRFIRNSAFRQLMNAKFNEYTLADRLDDIHGIDDALRIMREAAVASKPMKMISAFPELFADSSVRRILENDVSSDFVFGGSTDSVLPEAITSVLRSLNPERLRTGAFKREFDDLLLGMTEKDTPTFEALKKVSDSLPSPAESAESKKMVQYLQFSFENKMDLDGVFSKPGFLEAAELLLRDESVADQEFKALLKHHVDKTYDAETKQVLARESVETTKELLAIAGGTVSAIKDVPVRHANSYDSFLLSLTDTYSGKRHKTRQPFVWAMDALLAVDGTQSNRTFQRECAKVLHGIPISLYPRKDSLLPVTESLCTEVQTAAMNRYDLYFVKDGVKGPWMTEGTFIHGVPAIDHFLMYRKQDVESPDANAFDDDIQIVTNYSATVPLRMDEKRFIPGSVGYMDRRQREQMFGGNPRKLASHYTVRPLRLANNHSRLPIGKPFAVDQLLGSVKADDAITTLGAAFNIDTQHTQLHKLVDKAVDDSNRFPVKKLVALIASACQHGASAHVINGVGNSLIHDVLAKGSAMQTNTMIDIVTTLVMHGGHFADKNHFGVSLVEMLPMGTQEKLEPIALSSSTAHHVAAAFDDLLPQPAAQDPLEQHMEDDLLQGPAAHRKNAGMAL